MSAGSGVRCTLLGVPVLQCTRKLLAMTGSTAEASPLDDVYDHWHADLFYLDRRKCVLAINDQTLFPVLMVGLRKAELVDIGASFRDRLCWTLGKLAVAEETLSRVSQRYSSLTIIRTANRSVSGSLTQMIKEVKWMNRTQDVERFLLQYGSTKIPEFHVAEALRARFLPRFE